MDSVSKPEIQRALVNVTKSERAAVGVPAGFIDVDWLLLDFYGWRDPKFPQRGYLIRQRDEALIAVAVGTTSGGLARGRKAMCGICHAVDNSAAVELFTARLAGPSGRSGNTVGTYICSGLDCSAQLRDPSNRVGRSRLGTEQNTDEVAAQMIVRLDAFFDAVRSH